ncbi:hypothetical protein CRYUN_Cryun04dG0109000 [Craigia yunnanensis]
MNSHIVGVEFDVLSNQEFDDINDNHVGVDVNSLKSVASNQAGFWGRSKDDKFKELKLNNGVNYQVWIDHEDSIINVTMAKVGDKRPRRPLHRNLVGLRGLCRNDKGSLILVYDYMENGSVDMRIFYCDEDLMLSWDERIKVLKDVASGIWYLHEGWEAKVLHRDIKASNVLLDKDMNARLGDFGLARMHHHGELASTTKVVGTYGRRPIEEGKPGLIDWAWRLMERRELISALDDRLKAKGGYTNEEVERILHLGLLCAHPEPHVRPTMRQVMKLLEVRVKGAESEEGMELNLLDRMRTTTTTTMWGKLER